jgi:hypothetical protein
LETFAELRSALRERLPNNSLAEACLWIGLRDGYATVHADRSLTMNRPLSDFVAIAAKQVALEAGRVARLP